MTDELVRYGENWGVWRTRYVHRRTAAKASLWRECEGLTGLDTWRRSRPNVYTITERNGKVAIGTNALFTPETARLFAADVRVLAERADTRTRGAESAQDVSEPPNTNPVIPTPERAAGAKQRPTEETP